MASHEAMTLFCRNEHPRLVGALTLQVGDRWVAEELAQEALIRACQHWEKVSQMTSPRAWLHRVAQNLARSWWRRHSARPVHEYDSTDGADRLALRDAVQTLPDRQRMALVLRYYADLPGGEVAGVMGCAESTVRALTYQAISQLRRHGGLIEENTDAR